MECDEPASRVSRLAGGLGYRRLTMDWWQYVLIVILIVVIIFYFVYKKKQG
jgi:hypothetical protein